VGLLPSVRRARVVAVGSLSRQGWLQPLGHELAADAQHRAGIDIPTIGIGAGPHCDGQIALVTDMLGIESKLALSFSKRFAQVGTEIERAFGAFIAEIDAGVFPGSELTTPIAPIVLRSLEEA